VQIIGVLREQEAGSPTEEVCRRHGISQQTFYRWKAVTAAWTCLMPIS
jgi:putative transposase